MTTPAQHSPAAAPISQAPPGTVSPLQVPAHPGRSVGWIAGVVVVALLVVAAWLFEFIPALGVLGTTFFALIALVPLVIVVLVVLRVDRWEREPARLLWFALLWGAGAAVVLTLGYLIVLGTEDEYTAVVVQAPIVEEITKGIGVLLIFLFARRAFDGPVDGLVYGALVGAGFAFTENVGYFAISAYQAGWEGLVATFVVRGLLAPFGHLIYTGITGLALGLAAQRGLTRGRALLWGLAGMLVGMGLHALWNYSAGSEWLVFYLFLHIPLFGLLVWGVVYLLRRERALTHERLTDYARAGWFTPQEVDMLATPQGRRNALRWAATLPGNRRPAMAKFISAATSLAFARHRALIGRDPLAATVDEPAHLQAALAARAEVLRPARTESG